RTFARASRLLPGLVRQHGLEPLHERDTRPVLDLRQGSLAAPVHAVTATAPRDGRREADARAGPPGVAPGDGRRSAARSGGKSEETRRPGADPRGSLPRAETALARTGLLHTHRVVPGVDVQGRARDVAGIVGEEEAGSGADIVRIDVPVQRGALLDDRL